MTKEPISVLVAVVTAVTRLSMIQELKSLLCTDY